jgi:hypothetical protein
VEEAKQRTAEAIKRSKDIRYIMERNPQEDTPKPASGETSAAHTGTTIESPETFTGSPETFTGSPETFTGSPETFTGSPETFTGSPFIIGEYDEDDDGFLTSRPDDPLRIVGNRQNPYSIGDETPQSGHSR